MKPIRDEQYHETISDPWEFRERHIGAKGTSHVVSDEGSLSSSEIGKHFACDCGCLRPPRAFCAICVQSICEECYGICSDCHKPICPRDSTFSKDSNGAQTRLCKTCSGYKKRKHLLRSALRALFSPFVEFEDTRDE